MAVAPLISCAQLSEQQEQSIPPVPLTSPAKEEDGVRPDDARIVTFEKPRLKVRIGEWWPTEVISISEVEKGSHRGDWIIEIRNVSDKPVTSAVFLLDSPADCDAFVMWGGRWVGLNADDPYLRKPTKPTLNPGETYQIVLMRRDIAEIIPPRKLADCPPEKTYCYLFIDEVRYADGTKWQVKHDPEDPNWKDR